MSELARSVIRNAVVSVALIGLLVAVPGSVAGAGGVVTPMRSGVTASGTNNGVANIGIYPSQVSFPRSLRGGSYNETIGIINDSPKTLTFALRPTGDMATWLSVRTATGAKEISSLVVPPGATPTTAVLHLVVPKNAGNGTYKSLVDVTSALSSQAIKGSEAVTIQALIAVTAQVTGSEVMAGTLFEVSSVPAIEVGSPLRIYTKLANKGNVFVDPLVYVSISGPAGNLFHQDFHQQRVAPGEDTTLEYDWPAVDTSAAAVGNYAATVRVSFPGLLLGSKQLRFKVVPFGTLTRRGSLLHLQLVNHPKAGQPPIVAAIVENTGQIEAETAFTGRLYLNNSLLAGQTSAPLLVQPGTVATIYMVLPTAQNGSYRLTGVANFAGVPSGPAALMFHIGSPSRLRLVIIVAAGGGLLLVLVIAFSLWRHRRRRRRRSLEAPVLRQAPAVPMR